jgi:tRNA(Ile)-lysidine synthase
VPLVRAVARALDEHAAQDARVAVALSGGRDSVALLAAACEARPGAVSAVHVHHGLSSNADAWAASCAALAASLHVPLVVRRVRIEAGDRRGIEAAARALRYEALRDAGRELGVRTILLAHHRDDQVETLLLQLQRGAGPHGLAGMPAATEDAGGFVWLRPWLDVPRSAIEAFVRERGLAYVDDESNASARHRRNALRRTLVPALQATFPAFAVTLARSAAHQAEAARLLDELAAIDAAALVRDGTLDRRGFAALSPHRGRNLLRHFLRQHGLRMPAAARLAAMHAQLRGARDDAHVDLLHDGVALGVFRGRIVVHRPAAERFEQRWSGEAALTLPHGVLHFATSPDGGLAQARIERSEVVVRARRGGERFQPHANRPRRALKLWLHEAGMPSWQRDSLPLVFCDGELAAVPGIGVDVAFAGAPGIRIDWQPN